ncbi:MAG: ABC transporter substrate-binding protein [Nitrospirota bacterium]|nr:ABC transporter substrate-binding protein [Nitrospirota bacterium]
MNRINYKSSAIFAIISIIIVLIIVFSFGCAKKEPNEIKIGAILPLTGTAASLGVSIKNGQQLAIEHINQKGGINGMPLKLIVEDGGGDPKTSVAALKKLIEVEKVKIVVSTISSVCLALIPIADENKVIFFATAAHPEITGRSKYVFRHNQTAEQEAEIISNYIIHKLSPKPKVINMAIFNDDFGIAYQKALFENFNKIDEIKIEKNIIYERTETDFRTIVQKLLKPKPDLVITEGFGKQLGILIKRLREYHYEGPIFANLMFSFPDVKTSAGEAAKGAYYPDFAFNKSDPLFLKLKREYKERFNDEMPNVSVMEYNSILLIAEAMHKVGYNSDAIANYIRNLKHFRGVGEEISISPRGGMLPALEIKRF